MAHRNETINRLWMAFQASGLSVCEFTTLSLLELAKLNIAELQDIDEGIAHLKEHFVVLDGDQERMRHVLDIVTFH
ncbi:hypothetical protein NKJ88_05965 [Mesorhizobium sp. M0016]|uniref:hypothetical protein n=1 Tax=Mesorhizobium sp. M0016 TaxID=2956843 RepID=UPI0033362984